MAYDFFSQPRGPDIDINLIPNAMKAGADVGNSIPSQTSAIINGLLGGLKTGESLVQGYQQIQQNQHEIDQQPVTDELNRQKIVSGQHSIDRQPQQDAADDAALARSQALTEAQQMQNELQKKTQGLEEINQVKQLGLKSQQADQQLEDIKTQQKLDDLMGSSNEDAKRSILTDPSINAYFRRNKDAETATLGALAGSTRADGSALFSQEEQQNFAKRIDFVKTLDQQRKEKEVADKLNAKAGLGIENSWDKLMESNGALRGALHGVSPEEVGSDSFQVVPKGSKQTFPGTNQDNPAATDNSIAGWTEAMGYDVIKGGKILPFTLSADDAGRAFAFKDTWARAMGRTGTNSSRSISTGGGQPAPQPGQQQQVPQTSQAQVQPPTDYSKMQSRGTPAPIQRQTTNEDTTPYQSGNIQQLSANVSSNTQVSEDDATSILLRGEEAGRNRSWLDRQKDSIAAIAPSWMKNNNSFSGILASTGLANDNSLTSDVRQVAKNTAEKMAARTLEEYQDASPEQKDAAEKWSEANGVPLDYTKLKNHFMEQTVNALGTGYDTMYQQGVAEAGRQQQIKNAGNAAQEQATAAYKDKPLSAISKIQKSLAAIGDGIIPKAQAEEPEVNPVQAAKNNIPQVAAEYNLGAKAEAHMSSVAQKVLTHPLLVDKSALFKAVASVESGGDSKALSPTGVKGLVQVTQRTAGRYGLDRNDPEQNVMAGELYLEDLKKMFGGDEMLSTAAYNGGEGTIQYAQKLAGSDSWEDVKPHIYAALVEMKRRGHLPSDMNLVKKAKEVLQYPDRVEMYKKLYA